MQLGKCQAIDLCYNANTHRSIIEEDRDDEQVSLGVTLLEYIGLRCIKHSHSGTRFVCKIKILTL